VRPHGYEVPIMRAVICESLDGLQSLKLGQMPEPAASAGQILVDVYAASVSFMDCLMVAGKYQMRPQTPFVPGTDAAGVVTEVGEGVTRFRPGDRVACGSWFGAYAEKMAAPQASAAADDQVFEWIAQGKLKPYVQAVLPLEKFMSAMEMVRDRKALGRVVLQVR